MALLGILRKLKLAPSKLQLIIFLSVSLALAIPVGFALFFSWQHSQQQQLEKVLTYAKDVQSRTDATTDQIANGFARLLQSGQTDPCASANIAIMRDIDLSSSYIQAVGYVADNRLICSSLGESGSGWSLGPLDFTTSKGAKVRLNVHTPFPSDSSFTVIEGDGGFAAIIHKELPIDASTAELDASLATFALDNNRIYSSRGLVKSEWIAALGERPSVTFVKDGYVVAVVRSVKWRTGALAALPATYLDQDTRQLGLWLLPLGLVTGLVLAWCIMRLITAQVSMPSMMRQAIRRKEFFMVYQPVADLKTRSWVGVEALLRWKRPNGEMIRPDIFIQVAEEAGLICQITELVMEMIGQDAQSLFQQHPDFHIAINLSVADIESSAIHQKLHALQAKTAARKGSLIIEVTERGFMHSQIARKQLHEIRGFGIPIAIDDFGTGYSSLSYLDSFELDYLKIDKSFVDKIGTEAATSHVVPHIINMAHEMQLKMVAEGVETEAQAKYLLERGVHFGQGWLFAKPMLMSELLQNLN